jgi:hypothetical protein
MWVRAVGTDWLGGRAAELPDRAWQTCEITRSWRNG